MADDAVLEVVVAVRAAREAIALLPDGTLQVRVHAAAVEGAANRALINVVSTALNVAPGRVELVAGLRSRRKRLRVAGLTTEEVRARLS